jgi:hypothetical protein
MTSHAIPERLLVQMASDCITNLQAHRGLPQDLVGWLAPTLHVSSFLSKRQAPDIVAVGFQELPGTLCTIAVSVPASHRSSIKTQIASNQVERMLTVSLRHETSARLETSFHLTREWADSEVSMRIRKTYRSSGFP